MPDAYNLAIRVDNNLIDIGKLLPKPSMPIFLELSAPVQDQASPSSSIPPQSMYVYPNTQQSDFVTSTSLVAEVNDMKKLLKNFSNEIINIKRQ